MNKSKIIEAIDSASTALSKLKEAFVEEPVKEIVVETKQETPNAINAELLAKKVAYAYTTLHPEYKADSQYKNLTDMVKCAKITYVINWLRRKNTEGIENFFELSMDQQRLELLNAIGKYEKEIKEVFTKRFAQQ